MGCSHSASGERGSSKQKTINRAAPCDNYPIPKTEDLFATLEGGEKFSKLDLSHAYQQLKLDKPTQELLTVNTHRGLYQPTRLQFGIHSATGIFQREIEKRVRGIPYCKVRVDDILVSGRNDQEHLAHLETVLKRLSESGLRLRKEKCQFFMPEVTYLGFRVNQDGAKPVPEKVTAISAAPSPKNVAELRSYLGMLQYYIQSPFAKPVFSH